MIIERIQIFPIKSLDGLELEAATITSGCVLAFDRRWAIHRKRDGRTVNGKKYPTIHQLRASFDLEKGMVVLQLPQQSKEQFSLFGNLTTLNTYLSDYFGEEVEVLEDKEKGFPDHATSDVGASLISRQTLEQVGQWFDWSFEEVNRRMRMNFIIDMEYAFQEDTLLSNSKENPNTFLFGRVEVQAYKPCVRCVVPTRNSFTGEALKGFQKEYMQHRLTLNPHLLEHPLYPHPYMCGLVLKMPVSAIGKTIGVGAAITPLQD